VPGAVEALQRALVNAPEGYEQRTCFRCDRGRILHAAGPMERPTWSDCQHCGGTGVVWAFVYPQVRRGDVRRMGESRLLFLAWNGSEKEKPLAEKELRRRERGQ
jgi:hypothetical protein